jgi:hypothetical protein
VYLPVVCDAGSHAALPAGGLNGNPAVGTPLQSGMSSQFRATGVANYPIQHLRIYAHPDLAA